MCLEALEIPLKTGQPEIIKGIVQNLSTNYILEMDGEIGDSKIQAK